MMRTQPAEPPSCLHSLLFMIGQDSHGNWVVQDQGGIRGGLFVDRVEALRYMRSENGNHPPAFVAVSGVFELDMTTTLVALPQRRPRIDALRERRVA
jgi:hypothetical protein